MSQKEPNTFLYMAEHIKNVVNKLCVQYQNPGNNTIKGIIMLWMNLFGSIYSSSYYYQHIYHEKHEVFSIYEEMKEDILNTLKKIPIESVNKITTLPNPLAKLFKGQKIMVNADFIYSFIQILQPPCEPISSLLLLGCYWLFPKDK